MLTNDVSAMLLAQFYFSGATSQTAQALRLLIEKSMLEKEYHEYTPKEMEATILEYLDFMDNDMDAIYIPILEGGDDLEEEDFKD